MHADAFEQRNVLVGDLAILFSLEGIGSDGRQNGLEVFKERVWLFHGWPCLLLDTRPTTRIDE
ncbi:hypothetical protein D3C81_1845060 [compost metagenome]